MTNLSAIHMSYMTMKLRKQKGKLKNFQTRAFLQVSICRYPFYFRMLLCIFYFITTHFQIFAISAAEYYFAHLEGNFKYLYMWKQPLITISIFRCKVNICVSSSPTSTLILIFLNLIYLILRTNRWRVPTKSFFFVYLSGPWSSLVKTKFSHNKQL